MRMQELLLGKRTKYSRQAQIVQEEVIISNKTRRHRRQIEAASMAAKQLTYNYKKERLGVCSRNPLVAKAAQPRTTLLVPTSTTKPVWLIMPTSQTKRPTLFMQQPRRL